MPIFRNTAAANPNNNLIFCTVDVTVVHDVAEEFNIQSIPHFVFMLNGEKKAELTGADERKFSENVQMLHDATAGTSGNHMGLLFEEFKPTNMAPTCFTATTNVEKMKEAILKHLERPGFDEGAFKTWMNTSFNIEKMPDQIIDELIAVTENSGEKIRGALIDLLRLVVLTDTQAQHVFGNHWDFITSQIF
jgi:hypothetical protein